ncbi:MAG: copper amine oxidase, partial [Paenibacillaceae bacterium]|nr:copper amine oxidase [Paenibacillaceae bacterium]
MKKKWSLLAVSLLLLQSGFATATQAADAVLNPTTKPTLAASTWGDSHPTFKVVSEEPVTSGAILRKLVWTTTRSGKPASVNVDAIQVDLQNPNVKLDVMTGTNNQFTKKQSVMDMATETRAVAGVNGDFFDTQAEGVPIGGEISNSQIMATPPYLPGFYSFAIDKDNHPIIDEFTFQGSIKTKDGASYPLGGVNKTYYWYEADGPKPPTPQVDDIDGVHSMIDGLYMYTNAWGQVGRSNDGVTNPSEVLVQYNRVSNIGISQIINLIPPKEGYILRAAGKAADFVQQHMKIGDPLIADYSILPADSTKKYDANHFKMMIGGGTILVDEGKPAEFSRNDADNRSYRSRTSVGYSQDQRYAYIITADHSSGSAGASLTDMQNIMVQMGVWKGMNLDGGGSTQMVSRPLGQFGLQLVNQTENGDQRKVVNGLAVYSLAKPGEVKDFTIQGETNLLLNEKTSYRLSGYDEFYNPVLMDKTTPIWSMTNGIGMLDGNTFTALKPGETELTATLGKAQRTMKVQVIGKDQIASMKVIPSSNLIAENSDIALQVEITTKTGEKKIAPPEAIHWELRGFEGTVQGNTLHIGKLSIDHQQAAVIASYDGYNAMAALDRG